ncbi:MAG: hypothetical protein HQ568_04240 [Calditrichaeota bacterium]|nr:hypothetical protein [Calditrichota bacterium]
MAHEGEGQYLSDKETVDNIYGFIQQGRLDSATAFLKGLGEDKVVITTWINVQCDINNVMKGAMASSQIGQVGVDYCLEKGHKLPAAMMLHNISSFSCRIGTRMFHQNHSRLLLMLPKNRFNYARN